MSLSACAHPEQRQRVLFPARDYITGDPFVVQHCEACGLDRTVPQPSAEDIERYYPPGYYGEGQRYAGLLERLLDRLYESRAQTIEKVTGVTRGHVLDIGCGRGSLLFQLQRRGWRATGTEMSETSARYAREDLHLDVRTGDLHELHVDGPFDLVILWHVLEHIPDPAALLHAVSRLLRPGGTLLVAVPNFGSFEARLGQAGWFHLDVPRHVNHFTPRSLGRMLEAEHLAPYHKSYASPEYDVFSFVQTMLNILKIRHNLLYNLIRTRGAKMLADEPRRGRGQVLLTLLIAPILGAASLVWVPAAMALRQGATLTIYARKPSA